MPSASGRGHPSENKKKKDTHNAGDPRATHCTCKWKDGDVEGISRVAQTSVVSQLDTRNTPSGHFQRLLRIQRK